jgi:GT2 family glycosyltransferase
VSPAISVIVLNYNGREWLRPCLDAIARQVNAPPFETIVADNGSTDGSMALVASEFPAVRVVDNERNLGFAAGNNRAARAASAPLLVFLNNDTVPDPDWLARLHAAHAAADRQIVTSRIMFLNRPDVVDSAGDGYFRAGGAYKRGHGSDSRPFHQSGEVFGACGAGFLIPRAIFDELGGFDEAFFMVYEDVDLSYRARLAGYRCWYAADAVVRHAGSGTLGTMSAAAVYHGQRNLEWTWMKNTPTGLMVRTLPVHAVYSIAGVVHYALRGRAGAALRGKIAALAAIPRIIRARRSVQRAARIDTSRLEAMMDRGWLGAKRREKSAR